MNDERMIDVEIKLTHMEDQVDEMNKVIFQQQQQINELQEAMRQLSRRLNTLSQSQQSGMPADERPPHY